MASTPIDLAIAMPVVVFGNSPRFDHLSNLFEGAVSLLLLMASGSPHSDNTDLTTDAFIPSSEANLPLSVK
jgi:hypothetical protein